ncbi:MAG: prepilin-type N-terminal cleavage/methylation domain-containing protein [candidate division WOR-3 bacterium]|nr:prepilin-type N-terminal cleavage/methylation domain-containing protein [candidate division WOR-3 bacterium]
MRNQKGFTLIELLVVILIIGILLALMIPNFVLFQERARRASVKNNMHVVQTALEAYATDHNGNYPVLDEFADDAGIIYYLPGGDVMAVPEAIPGNWPINPYTGARYSVEGGSIAYSSGWDNGVFDASGVNAAVRSDEDACPYADWVLPLGADMPGGQIRIGTYPDAGEVPPTEYGIAGWGRVYADGEDHPCMYDIDPADPAIFIYYVLHN